MSKVLIRGFGMLVGLAAGGLAALIFYFSYVFYANGEMMTAVAILLGGMVNLIVVAGMAFLVLGIYHNTKRMADMLQRRREMSEGSVDKVEPYFPRLDPDDSEPTIGNS